MLAFNDLLAKAGIDPTVVNIARHTPSEPKLRRVMPWIASEQPELFEFYQSTQGPGKERMFKNRKYLASFLGLEDGSTAFVGLYKKIGERTITQAEFWQIPEAIELRKLGMTGFSDLERKTCLRFEFQPSEEFAQYKGRLFIDWPHGTRSWVRIAAKNDFPVRSIADENLLTKNLEDWNALVLSYSELDKLPKTWRERMTQWRGIYLITHMTDGKQYVGSATGEQNLLQRWRDYSNTRHGGNEGLKGLDPEQFTFSILELTAPNMPPDEVNKLENRWKNRLHTRKFGLNRN